jgi:hypothetical protein
MDWVDGYRRIDLLHGLINRRIDRHHGLDGSMDRRIDCPHGLIDGWMDAWTAVGIIVIADWIDGYRLINRWDRESAIDRSIDGHHG